MSQTVQLAMASAIANVCIYQGSFDPFHKGHQEVASEALNYAQLVVILPNNFNRHKPNRSNIIFRSHLLSKLYNNFLPHKLYKP